MAALQQPHMDMYVVPDIAVQFEAGPPVTAPEPIVPTVGIDTGPIQLATFFDGIRLAHPGLARTAEKRVPRLNRERDRCRKGSVNVCCGVTSLCGKAIVPILTGEATASG